MCRRLDIVLYIWCMLHLVNTCVEDLTLQAAVASRRKLYGSLSKYSIRYVKGLTRTKFGDNTGALETKIRSCMDRWKIFYCCLRCINVYWNLSTQLTYWGRVTHICVSKSTTIGSDNGLSIGRRQAIIWTNAAISLIGPLGTNFSETSIDIHTFSFTKIHLKLSSGNGG